MQRILLSLALVTSLSACAAMPTPYQEAAGSRLTQRGLEINQLRRDRTARTFQLHVANPFPSGDLPPR